MKARGGVHGVGFFLAEARVCGAFGRRFCGTKSCGSGRSAIWLMRERRYSDGIGCPSVGTVGVWMGRSVLEVNSGAAAERRRLGSGNEALDLRNAAALEGPSLG